MCRASSTLLFHPFLLSWRPVSPLGVGWSKHWLPSHCWCHVFNHILVLILLTGPARFPGVHTLSLCTVLDRQHLSSSCLLGAAPLALGHFWGSFWTYRPSSLPLVANPFEPLTESWYVRDEQEFGGSWLVWEEWDGVGRPLRYPSTTASGYPLSLNTCLRCLISWHLVLPSHTFLVLCFGHRMMSLLTLAKWLE